ncbi:MAG: hypothetical protein NC037_02980 [Bacteroides sp.]|nr:hypothetical protein [Muribaculaceae bacterium]MCM1455478.1 hypothetical protein [Bacteroides sp.]
MKDKLKKLWRWLRREILNKGMLLWLIIAELIFWSPVIVGGILGLIFDAWYFSICVAYMGFWTLPLTPAIPLQIGLAYGLKKIADAVRRRHNRKKECNDEPDDEQGKRGSDGQSGD